ncbi:hypothetical protein ACTFIU_008997 [Dictyostelium citrinum]
MDSVRFLNRNESALLDNTLQTEKYGFSMETLMELAGIGSASAIHSVYPNLKKKILTISGPGNNGGDGLVTSRHLVQYGYQVKAIYPKIPKRKLFHYLVKQCENDGIEFLNEIPSVEEINNEYGLIVDSIFGYNYIGDIRAPFNSIIMDTLCKVSIPIVSLDIPSGWCPELGNINNSFTPDFLISLAVPKIGTKSYKGKHYLGGRFLPKEIIKELNLVLPEFRGSNSYTDISHNKIIQV